MRSTGRRRASGIAAVAVAAALLVAGSALVQAKVFHGTRGDDRIEGTSGPDRLLGRGGADVLDGKWGADELLGGRGADKLRGGRGYDVMLGGPGPDRLDARDGQRDRLDCGSGNDVAIVDRVEDGVRNCERLVTP